MKEYIFIGKVVNTHGIKGEIRIKSDFLRKDLVFKKSINLYFGKDKIKETIKSYRIHKDYDMVTLNEINNINDVLKYKGQNVFVKRNELEVKKDEYLIEDLFGLEVQENKKVLGKVKDFLYNNGNILLVVNGIKEFYIPYNNYFIKKVDLQNKIVVVENAKDLII